MFLALILGLPVSHIIVLGLILSLALVGLYRLSTPEKKTNVKNKVNYIFANFLACMIWFVIGVVLFFSIAGFVLMVEDIFNKA